MLLRCLLQLFKQSKDVAYAYVFNSLLPPTEFLQYILSDFGLSTVGKNKSQLLLELGQFLISRSTKKQTTVLIVDEAHHLSAEILEEVRLLTNLETTDDKLIQILLVGQPELDQKLDSVGLRQLKQRIALRSHLEPLDLEETRGYIERRLQIAGATSNAGMLFPTSTVAAVYRHSRGFPRLINTICENALVTAYAKQMRSVTPEIIHGIADDFRLDVVQPSGTESSNVIGEGDVRRAAKTLLDMFAALHKAAPPEQEAEVRVPLEFRGRDV
jgi:type II secretory pathway predicted ATPase ExeA